MTSSLPTLPGGSADEVARGLRMLGETFDRYGASAEAGGAFLAARGRELGAMAWECERPPTPSRVERIADAVCGVLDRVDWLGALYAASVGLALASWLTLLALALDA